MISIVFAGATWLHSQVDELSDSIQRRTAGFFLLRFGGHLVWLFCPWAPSYLPSCNRRVAQLLSAFQFCRVFILFTDSRANRGLPTRPKSKAVQCVFDHGAHAACAQPHGFGLDTQVIVASPENLLPSGPFSFSDLALQLARWKEI